MVKLAWLTCVLLAAAPAAAQPVSASKQRARELFKEGEHLYSAGQYKKAIERYEAAYALVPLPLLLYDLGQAYRMNGQRELAIEKYRKYLDVDPDGRGAADARQQIAELAAELEGDNERAIEAARAEARRREEEQQRAREAPKPSPAAVPPLAVAAAPAETRKPVWKKAWLWGTVGGVAIAGVALGVGLGVGLSRSAPGYHTDTYTVPLP